MALNGIFSRRNSDRSGGATRSPSAADVDRLALLDQFEESELGWFWATDAEGKLSYLSASAAHRLGQKPEQMLGTPLTALFLPDELEDEDRAERPFAFQLRARSTISDMPVRVSVAGTERWWSICAKPQLDRENEFLGYRGSAKDITAVRESQRDASRLAQYDSLTGLANRHRMSKRLTATLIAYKAAKRSCALMMLDLDRFKQVNDTLGHPAGDELLKQVAQRLERIVGSKGEIGRLGGDEFQVMLPDIDDRGRLGEIANSVIQMISQPYSLDGSRAIIGTSVGIAIAPYDGIDTDELVSSADLALYAAKGGGRGQYRFFSSELKDGARLRRQIEEDLRDAIQSDQLELHYQPIVRTSDHKVTALEALVRWNHPERGWISPAEFIPVAEETNLINALGEWVLRRACRDAVEWPHSLRVAVNVSAIQFSGTDVPKVVRAVLDRSGLEPERLELEITESVFLGDPQGTGIMLKALKKIGVRLALDDFGTGYSSLGYLSSAPLDKIKIDRSFVAGLTEDENNNAAIITAIVSLARALKMETVAEGVEAMDELDLITKLGASHIQGYIFSKALTHDALLERLLEGGLQFEPEGPAKHRADRRSTFRRVGVIHEDHRYEVVMRNLSRTGAGIEGLLDVPLGTPLVLDLGGGQLAVAEVVRSEGYSQGLEFEQALINDGADGLCTRHRISPYALASAGMPLAALPPGSYLPQSRDDGPKSRPAFLQVDLAQTNRAA
ncbi:EAL domain-containing protein [Altererythrobacter sp. TH136]|uniref:EAL domain-containing protein n=1 Tax=Altererythrobacter sp. TH136 TaxID=2067415 RepID=UPI001162AB9C|nr:EAL domain-containing protein [Altererythrobacter sp. TH136]QDM39795.1 EAL domain-containing protein [Altererythrobacter sp. TH136]